VINSPVNEITGNVAHYNQVLGHLRSAIDDLGALGNDLGAFYRAGLQRVDGDALANMFSPEQQQSILRTATRVATHAGAQGVGVEEAMGAVRSGGIADAGTLTRAQRELAARMVDEIMTPQPNAPVGLNEEQIDNAAEDLIVALDQNLFQGSSFAEEARDAIDDFIRDLRERGEDAYIDALGMMTADYPYSDALRDRMIHHLEELRDEYRD
jgi:hypothetical protein